MSEKPKGSYSSSTQDTFSSKPRVDKSRERDSHKRGNSFSSNRPYERRAPQKNFSANREEGEGVFEKSSGPTDFLIDLDRDIMKLLVKRAKLVSRIREGKDHASGATAVIAEKAVRRAWEQGAIAFSKDPKFTRQLFDLLQDLQVISKSESLKDAYNLAPVRKPAEATLFGTPSSLVAQMHICLASALGGFLSLPSLTSSDGVLSCINVCTQAGAPITSSFSSAGVGGLTIKEGDPLSTVNKTLFIGDGLFSLYFFSLLAVKDMGSTRLSGGGEAKEANLSPLRQFLPLLGARFTHLVPRSTGLPVSIESSGAIPKVISAPADFPFEGVCALLLVALCWDTSCSITLEALPAHIATSALAEVATIFHAAGQSIEMNGSTVVYFAKKFTLPKEPLIPLDPIASAYQLAIPVFSGGSVTLKGQWPTHLPSSTTCEAILSWAGIKLEINQKEQFITATCNENFVATSEECVPFFSARQASLDSTEIPSSLVPLVISLAAVLSSKPTNKKKETCLPMNFFQDGSINITLAQSMLSYIGMTSDGLSVKHMEEQERLLEKPSPLVCQNAYWGAAYALCSYMKPGLKLVNPAEVSTKLPLFWNFFNGLPTPKDPMVVQPKKEVTPEKKRRRIVTE